MSEFSHCCLIVCLSAQLNYLLINWSSGKNLKVYGNVCYILHQLSGSLTKRFCCFLENLPLAVK